MRLNLYRVLLTYQIFPLMSCATAFLAHKGFITSLANLVGITTMALVHSYFINTIISLNVKQAPKLNRLNGEHNVN